MAQRRGFETDSKGLSAASPTGLSNEEPFMILTSSSWVPVHVGWIVSLDQKERLLSPCQAFTAVIISFSAEQK